jgi:DNA-binding SARP family transcriptional activator
MRLGERIGDLLWPDLEPEAAAQNVRVTLSRLRRLVEPEHTGGGSVSRIRRNGDSIELVHPPLVDGCLRLGELLLVAGRFDESLRCADRSLVASPYSERAHRLAIACHLQRHDHAGIESAVRSARSLLDELAVEPDPATTMLLRRAAVRLQGSS